jgi:hypothetical protein
MTTAKEAGGATALRTVDDPGVPLIGPRRGRIIIGSVIAGLAIAALWSAQLVDDDIGVNTANGLLGQNAAGANLTGTIAGLVFAFVTGLAGTFTACNVAVFSAIAPMLDSGHRSMASRARLALNPLGWLSLGAVGVAAVYGAIGSVVGSKLPQLSTATVGNHVPVRVLQSITVFGVIGLIMLYLGLGALGMVPDPISRLSVRWAPARQLVMGMLIGGFLIGRPWPLFYKMFQHAAATHNAAFGAGALALVAIGNMLVMGILFVLLALSGLPRWLRARANRATAVTAVALLVGGSFTVAYWCLRVPTNFGFGWFPIVSWH